jgi:hypothetical protein
MVTFKFKRTNQEETPHHCPPALAVGGSARLGGATAPLPPRIGTSLIDHAIVTIIVTKCQICLVPVGNKIRLTQEAELALNPPVWLVLTVSH